MKKMIAFLLVLTLIVSVLTGLTFSVTANAQANPDGADVARAIGDEGIVLMKNKNEALPLRRGESVAVFGEAQKMWIYGASAFDPDQSMAADTLTYQHGYIPWGAGSSRALGAAGVAGAIDPLTAFRQAVTDGRLRLYAPLSEAYEDALEASTHPTNYVEYVPDDEMYEAASDAADTAVVFLRRWDGECVDLNAARNGVALPNWSLTADEKLMLQRVSALFDKVVVVLNTPGPIDTNWSLEDNEDDIDVDALVFEGYGGMTGGQTLLDVLLGDATPSGKLVDTWAKELDDYPTTESFLNDNDKQRYTEDVYLGYRYFETFNVPVNYEFGFGLSYTDFTVTTSDFAVSGGNVTFNATVTNTGTYAGKEVIEVYFSAPQGVLGKPAKVLCAFDKTDLLLTGQSQTLALSFAVNDMASYDDTGKTDYPSAYVLEAGDYRIYAGTSVKDLTLAGTHTVSQLTLVEQLSAQCPTTLDKRLLADGTFETLNSASDEKTAAIGETGTVQGEKFFAVTPTASNAGFPGKTEVFAGKLFNEVTRAWEAYSGSGICDTYKLSYATYKLNVAEAGSFYVTARVAGNKNANASPGVTLKISTDGETYSDLVSLTGYNTWTPSGSDFYGFIDVTQLSPVSLPAGEIWLRVSFSGACNFDLVNFTRTDAALEIPAGGSLVLQAERYFEIAKNNYIKRSAGVAKLYDPANDAWNAYTPNPIFVDSYWPGGSFTSYKVIAPADGTYNVTMRASAIENNAGMDLQVSADNVTWTKQSMVVNVENTAALAGIDSTSSPYRYTCFKDYDYSGQLVLKKGLNYIRVAKGTQTAPNVDLLVLTETVKEYDLYGVGTQTFEAEAFTSVDMTAAYNNDAGRASLIGLNQAGKIYNDAAGQWESASVNALCNGWKTSAVYYEVDCAFEGDYELAFLAATSSTSTGKITVASSADAYASSVTVTCTDTATGSGSTYHGYKWFRTEQTIHLDAGINQLRLKFTTPPNVDKFTLTGVKRLHAADYFELGDTNASYDAFVGAVSGYLYDGSAWNSFSAKAFQNMWVTGAYMTLRVNVPLSGTYDLGFRAACSAGANKAFGYRVSTDNVNWGDSTYVDMPQTYQGAYQGPSQWNSFIDVTGYTVHLTAGTNYLKIFGNGGNMNFESAVLYLKEADAVQPRIIWEPEPKTVYDQLSDVAKGTVTMQDFVHQMTTSELATFFVSYSAYNFGGSSAVQSKYGIKGARFSDGPAGLASAGSAFPCETIIASTWNRDLAYAFALIVGSEGALNNIDVWAAPAVNLHRNPLCGRNSEYYSEDPYLSGAMAVETVRGAQEMGLIAVVKHFVCNEKEANKLSCDSQVSERALREVYLKPFRMALCEGGAMGIMSSYNLVNGYGSSMNYDLLTNILRNEWGYTGYVSGDWNNTKDAIAEINAGNSVREPAGFCNINDVLAAIADGRITRETLETGAAYELNTLMRIKAFRTAYASTICGGSHTYVGHICTKCGSPETTAPLVDDLLDENTATLIVGANVELGATLTVNYCARLKEEDRGAKMEFTRNGKTVTVDGVYDEEKNWYVFSYTGITPQCMADNIDAVLKKGDKVIDQKETYSVAAYANSIANKTAAQCGLTDTKMAALKTLLADMLNYGRQAQLYTGYAAETPCNDFSWVASAQSVYVTPVSVREATAASGEDKFVSMGLWFANVNRVYFRFTAADPSQLTLKLYRNGALVKTVSASSVEDNTLYSDDIFATGFDDRYVCSLYRGDELLQSVTYSVNSYVAAKENDASVGALVKALSAYGASTLDFLDAE